MTILIALGSNKRHSRFGEPGGVLDHACAALEGEGILIEKRSRRWTTQALGPSDRNYANMVVAVRTDLPPEDLLNVLHAIEHRFGRQRWRRWGARVLDLDLVAYGEQVRPSARRWPDGSGLVVPHPEMHRRDFVLAPALEVAPDWRHPVFGLTVRQMLARLQARR